MTCSRASAWTCLRAVATTRYLYAAMLQQFRASLQADLELLTSTMKALHQQIKPMVADVEKVDKEFKSHSEKVEKAREKYVKAAKDHEELIVTIQAAEWNKETPVMITSDR